MSGRIAARPAAAWIAALVVAVSCRADRVESRGVAMLPGAPPVAAELAERLRARASSSAGRDPHTRHRTADGAARFVNRLILETSPYLLQHAHNPVDWYPWGEEAFAAARRLGRPILVSIGYSTCHWCHVMAEESFDDLEIATYLNQRYVAIKVDREERPEVDATYLRAAEAMGEHGGWPLTVLLLPDGAPFFAGTYFPARDGDRGVRVGFLTVLGRARETFDGERDDLSRRGERVSAAMRELVTPPASGPVDPGAGVAALEAAVGFYRQHFDGENGGLAIRGERNKFPSSLPVPLLLRYARRTGDRQVASMAERTLERMAAGGIHDKVGGGFHRYATDARWLVPHFEKMLYDNALVAMAYLDGHQATGRADFAEVARRTLEFVERELGAPDGGFFAALDADSPGAGGERAEGLYYTWTPSELGAAVGEDRAALVGAYLGVSRAGNFDGRSIVHVARPLAEVAAAIGLDPVRAGAILEEAWPLLAAARDRRPRPHRDEKVLAGWNGLAISALARAALILDRGRADGQHLARARRAAASLVTRLVGRDGRLTRVASNAGGVPGTLEDYAMVIAGLLDLFEASGEERWLERAVALDRVLARDFEDPAGGFFSTAEADRQGEVGALLLREKPVRDGAVPSGNSVQAANLLRLHQLTSRDEYRARADRLFEAMAGLVARDPTATDDLLAAIERRHDASPQIVLVAPGRRAELEPFLAAAARVFSPSRALLAVDQAEVERMATRLPLLEGKTAMGGRATAFVCYGNVCRLPTRDPAAFEAELRRVEPLR